MRPIALAIAALLSCPALAAAGHTEGFDAVGIAAGPGGAFVAHVVCTGYPEARLHVRLFDAEGVLVRDVDVPARIQGGPSLGGYADWVALQSTDPAVHFEAYGIRGGAPGNTLVEPMAGTFEGSAITFAKLP